MSIQDIAANIKSSVTEALNAVQLPEGVEVSAEVKQQLADAGVRGTLDALDNHSEPSPTKSTPAPQKATCLLLTQVNWSKLTSPISIPDLRPALV